MKKFTYTPAIGLVLAVLVLSACNKSSQDDAGMGPVDHMEDLVVDGNFNWSASLDGTITIKFDNPDNISVDREMLYLTDSRDQVIEKVRVYGDEGSFNVELPANEEYFVHFPYTGQKMKIDGPGTYQLLVADQGSNKRWKNGNSSASCTVCASPIVNNLAEQPVINPVSYTIISENQVPGWQTTAPDGKIEIWSTGFNGVPAQEGNQFFEINANNHPNAALYQSLCLEPGSTIRWSVYHRARVGTDVARVSIGATVATAVEQGLMSDGTNAWGYHSGSYTVPMGQSTTVFVFEAVSTGSGNNSVGNFLDNFRIECDEDGDGVVDTDDDYPQDPNRAYRSYYPSSGKQILAFEDLWPAKGDYDFNDLGLSQQVEIARDANNELVDAHFKISIDAIGAGLNNGIALLLRKQDGGNLSSVLVNNFTGDLSADPDNVNGFIISSDVYADISEYYQNNGTGPSKTPDTLSFTLNFNNARTANFIPEIYLFRTSDRGLEVHRPGFSGSAAFNNALLNTLDDNGNFKTAEGLPWAIEIVTSADYDHPKEKIDMVEAFPQFQVWATSNGSQNQTWYDFPAVEKIFDPSN